MAFLIDEAYLPATLTAPAMTDEEFSAFCAEHPDLNFEMTAERELLVMAPNHFFSSASNCEVAGQLRDWALRPRRGVVCDLSMGCVLPNGERRSPDASWTSRARLRQAGMTKRKGFLPCRPDFVIEIRSDSDRLQPLRRKTHEYLD